jgi:hypothetical protein
MMKFDPVEVHPVQNPRHVNHKPVVAPKIVTLRAYEVYCALYGEQPAMVTGGCRGGFGIEELLAFMYARTFPKSEWRERFEEALHGMQL